MAEIPWWMWLGIGLFVAVSSVFTGGQVTWFAWVGLVFVVVGIAKVVNIFVLSPRDTKKEQPKHSVVPPAFYCPACRMTAHQTDNFCRYCGTRLR